MRRKRPNRFRKYLPLSRLIGITAAVVVIVSGVTFAVLQSQQVKLTGNTIQTATANLHLSEDGVNYTDTLAGFGFDNLVPGGSAVPTNGDAVFLKNDGGTALTLKLAVSSVPLNPSNVDLSKVHVIVMPVSGGSTQNFTLQSLISSYSTGGQTILTPTQLAINMVAQYRIQVSMDSDAFSGPSASISNVDFSFSGVTVSN